MNRAGFVKRFDEYFGHRNDERTLELRKYVSEYFSLIGEVPEAYVPRIFVSRWRNSTSFTTSIACGIDLQAVFPPTDLVVLVRNTETPWVVNILGYAERDTLLLKLSPLLRRLDGYTLTKRLSSEYKYTKEIENMLKNCLKPVPDQREFLTVDMLPTFEEEKMHWHTLDKRRND